MRQTSSIGRAPLTMGVFLLSLALPLIITKMNKLFKVSTTKIINLMKQ